jgi:hypothetical protein
MFVEKYLRALHAHDLRDDGINDATDALAAAALADLSGGSRNVFGSLLVRAKYAHTIPQHGADGASRTIAALLRAWTDAVTAKGLARGWMKIKYEWDIKAATAMYAKIARVSLAHWLAGECAVCHGTRVNGERGCIACAGSGREPIRGGAVEREKGADMVSELEGLYQSHCARAGARLRRTPRVAQKELGAANKHP